MRIFRFCLISCLFSLYYSSALAAEENSKYEDFVAIKYLDGYLLPNNSSERLDLNIERFRCLKSSQDIDKYFTQVSTILAENKIDKDWQLAVPDAPSITIVITMNGKKLTFTSCHTIFERKGDYLVTENGVEKVHGQERAALLAKQSESFLKHRIVFEKILNLSLERANAQLAPSSTLH